MNSIEAIKAEPPYYRDVICYFKTNPCPKIHSQKDVNSNDICNPNKCFNFHSLQERRRLVIDEKTSVQTYEPKWCQAMKETGECQYQDSCRYCHTQNEINYHPSNYKTKLCTNCQFPSFPNQCPNYHADEGSRAVALERSKTKKSRENSSQRQGGDFAGQKGFNLDTFKTKQCTSKGNHNPKGCLFFHSEKDKRRSAKIFKYGYDICLSKGQRCPNGDACEFAHNIVEQLYHPEKYKKKFCSYHPHRIQQCDYGAYCSFAHSESEIKIELLHNLKKDRHFYVYKYKTIFCPYNSDHDRNQCLYAHNPQDFRRDPHNYKYNPVKCQYWIQKHITSYEKGGCPKLMDCENCHGWKELEYHPAVYKTKDCNENNCEKPDCPHFHPNRDVKEVVTTQFDFGAIAPPKQNFSNSIEKGAENHYDHFKSRVPVKKESNFSGPIKLIMTEDFSPNKQGRQINRGSQLADESTRPNSTASSTHYLEEKLTKRFSKKKKQMSLQNQKEGFPNSLPSKLGPTQGKISKRGSSAEFNFGESQFSKQEKASGIYEEFKGDPKFKRSEIPGSLESLDGFKPSEQFDLIDPFRSDLHDEQFKWNLANSLEREGLAYTVQFLLHPMMDCQALRLFNSRDFNKFPQISFQDKEMIVQIISALTEEERRTSLLRYDFQRGFASPTNVFERNFDKYH